MQVRPLLDELIVGQATGYIKRQAKAGKPFFTYVGLSHVHPPEQAHPDFDQTDPARLGLYAEPGQEFTGYPAEAPAAGQ